MKAPTKRELYERTDRYLRPAMFALTQDVNQ